MKRLLILIPLALWALIVFVLPSSVSAATIYVNSSTGNDTTGTGLSGAPFATFTKAYASSSANDTINLTGTFDWSNAAETDDTSGAGFTITKNITLEGQSAATTFIQASSTENTATRSVFTVNSGRTLTIKNLTIRYGVTTVGDTAGGITNSGTLNIQNSIITRNRYNSSSNYGGGAIFLKHDANSTLNISTSTISYNGFNGQYYGSGGVYAGQTNTINIYASTFAYNTATSSNPNGFAFSYAMPSGGFGVYRSVTTLVLNSTFSNNSTNSYGGGLQVYNPSTTFKLINSTVANNTAGWGAGGILFESSSDSQLLILRNTIVANNTATSTANDFHSLSGSVGRAIDAGYNIIEYSTNKTWSGTGTITGNQASLNLDAAPADNSATNGVQTVAITSGSIAIDAGTSTATTSVSIPGYDQRGATRNGSVDIGAFEFSGGGISDTEEPTILLSTPYTGLVVSGSAVLFSTSVHDDIGVVGVKFYIDGVQVGSEDTSDPFTMNWDSTTVANGPHTAYVVARDAAGNTGTSTPDTEFDVDNTIVSFSNISASSTLSGAVITWTTSDLASTQLSTGLTSSYGTTTVETDTSPRVTSHTTTLTGLPACTKYNYQLRGKSATDSLATSSNQYFVTLGCTGSATVASSADGSVATSTGGTVTGGNLTLTVPTNFTSTSSSAVFQIHTLNSTEFAASAGTPSGVIRAGNSVYALRALVTSTTTISTFTSPITVTFSYSAGDVSGIDESSLLIYRYNGSAWFPLSNCSVNTSAKTVACTTTSFSDFALFGMQSSSSGSSSGSSSSGGQSGGGGVNYGCKDPLASNYSLFVAHDAKLCVYVGRNSGQIIGLAGNSGINTGAGSAAGPTSGTSLAGSVQFTRDLYFGLKHAEVKLLQQYLNNNGFTVALTGPGSKGNETTIFGSATKAALIKYQKSVGIGPAVGFFGPVTRAYINSRR